MKIGDLKSIPFSSSCNQVLVNNLWILIFRCKTSICVCVCLCFGSGLTKFPVECMNDFEGVFIQLLTKNTSTNYKRKQKALTTTAEAAVYIVTETVSM